MSVASTRLMRLASQYSGSSCPAATASASASSCRAPTSSRYRPSIAYSQYLRRSSSCGSATGAMISRSLARTAGSSKSGRSQSLTNWRDSAGLAGCVVAALTRRLSHDDGLVPSLHVALNLVFLHERSGGVGRYARELVPALMAAEPGIRITAFVSRELPPAVRVVTLLDVVWLRYPEAMSAAATQGMRRVALPSARRADRVIAISHAAK